MMEVAHGGCYRGIHHRDKDITCKYCDKEGLH